MKDSGRTTREEQARATKALLLETALDLFAEQGYAATSTRQIAKQAGVSEGLIFHHYPTKLDLLMGVAAHRDAFAMRIRTVLESAENEPMELTIRAILRGFVSLLGPNRKETKLFRVLLSESMTMPEVGRIFRGISDTVIVAIADHLRKRMESGELYAQIGRAHV